MHQHTVRIHPFRRHLWGLLAEVFTSVATASAFAKRALLSLASVLACRLELRHLQVLIPGLPRPFDFNTN